MNAILSNVAWTGGGGVIYWARRRSACHSAESLYAYEHNSLGPQVRCNVHENMYKKLFFNQIGNGCKYQVCKLNCYNFVRMSCRRKSRLT